MECPICQEPLCQEIHPSETVSSPPKVPSETIQQFVADCKAHRVESETVFRLKCGHAFHSNCLLQHVLSQTFECPLCRAEPEDNANQIVFNFTVAGDEVNQPVGIADLGTLLQSVEAFSKIRQDCPRVQRARKEFNKVRREYISLENELIRERAQRLNEMVDRFAEDRQSD
jgi:hypothetical protein